MEARMRWRTAALCAVSLVGLVGCPETYGKDGTMDDAVEKDMEAAVEKDTCPPREKVKEICGERNPKDCFPGCKR